MRARVQSGYVHVRIRERNEGKGLEDGSWSGSYLKLYLEYRSATIGMLMSFALLWYLSKNPSVVTWHANAPLNNRIAALLDDLDLITGS